ncbi:S28 family serine protease [Streptomyces sp. NPDC004726]
MRKVLRWLLVSAMLVGTVSVGGVPAGAAPVSRKPAESLEPGEPGEPGEPPEVTRIRKRLLAIPGMTLIRDTDPNIRGHIRFWFAYEQPVDHRRPKAGTFKQRIEVFHRGEERPTALRPTRSVLDIDYGNTNDAEDYLRANTVAVEHRFMGSSRPDPSDWSKLDIWQMASDLHRVRRVLGTIYHGKWVSTGRAESGNAAVYHRRFYPDDVAGTVVFGAANHVRDNDDSAYEKFFAEVGTPECRARLSALQRQVLVNREEILRHLEELARRKGWVFDVTGSADRALELTVHNIPWNFWMGGSFYCYLLPLPSATGKQVFDYISWHIGEYTDESLYRLGAHHYLAGTQTGHPRLRVPHLEGLLRYPGINVPRTLVPRDIPLRFQRKAMRDVDEWVREDSSRMIFLYGATDPRGAERFRTDKGGEDSYTYTAPSHGDGFGFAQLRPADRTAVSTTLRRWAGVSNEWPTPAASPADP